MITRLLRRQLGHRRQHTIRVTSQHDDILWLTVHGARYMCVRDILDRVSTTSILRDAHVVVIRLARLRIIHDVLQDRAKADGTVNLWFLLRREVDALGVAPTLDVEHTTVTPAVLIITNESTLRVGRKGGLASTRQTEEEGHVAVLALVGRRVQGQDVVLDGHLVEEDGKDPIVGLC